MSAPRSRLQMWDVIRELVADGAALLLTTQYLDAVDRLAAQAALVAAGTGEVHDGATDRALSVAVTGGAASLALLLRRLEEDRVEVLDVGLRRPTLDDVFLTLTGHAAEEVPAEEMTGVSK